MRKTLESLSLRVLLGILGFTIVAFYVTKRFYYPPIPPPVQVDSAFLDDVKPAVIVNVDSCNFYVNKSLEYYNYGNFDLSLKAAEKAVTFNGLSEYAENNKCAALIALNRLEEALVACERAVFLAPKFENALGNTKWIKEQLAHPVQAENP